MMKIAIYFFTKYFQELETTKEGNKTLKDKLKKENRKSRHLIEKKENGQTPYFEVICAA